GLASGERRGATSEIDPARLKDHDELIAYLSSQPNDLEAPAVALQPVIAAVLAAIAQQDGCLIARMSGSGAPCFGRFAPLGAAPAAGKGLRAACPGWWVAPTPFG